MKITLTFLYLGIALALNGQSLPSTQKIAVAISGPIKVDGAFDEIKDNLQAYNKATNIYYTLANNEENLYLAIQVTDPLTFRKIIGGGISFTICNSGDKNQANPAVITYPLIDERSKFPLSNLFNNLLTERTATAREEVFTLLSKGFPAAQREIGVKGIKEIEDKEISVYNTNGIKAKAVVNRDAKMCFELILPLKLLGLDRPHQTIAYNIMLNGMALHQVVKPGANGQTVTVTDVPIGAAGGNNDYRELQYPTDFWAKYTLY